MENMIITFEDLLIAFQNVDIQNDSTNITIIIEALCNYFADLDTSNTLIIPSNQIIDIFVEIYQKLSIRKKLSKSTINLLLILLNNITTFEDYCHELIQHLENEKYQTRKIFDELIDDFLNYYPQIEVDDSDTSDWVDADPFQHISSILCNLCRIEEGRKIILNPTKLHMFKLVLQIRSRNIVRRRGVIAMIRRYGIVTFI